MSKKMPIQVWRYCSISRLSDVFHVHFKSIIARMMVVLAMAFRLLGNREKCAKYLMASIRYGYCSSSVEMFKRYGLLNRDVLYPQVSSEVDIDEAAVRSIVIRWPTYDHNELISKGILIITFTKVFSYYLRNIDINELSKHFCIVLEPSWSGYFDADILSWALETDEAVFIEAAELLDRVSLNALTSNLVPLSFGASDWVDYKSFSEQDLDVQYDSVYVANTNHIKRVVRYVKAIKNIARKSDPHYKGCLVCASWGGKEDVIRLLPQYFNVENNIDIRISLNKKELNEVINSSKVNILLSYKEGSNRSLFESMFANTPVICIAENIGVNKSYINEYTGLLISDRFLEDGLLYMKDNWGSYQPKKWALENISPEKTTKKILSILAARDGTADTSEVYYKTNNPEVSYLEHPGVEFSDINKKILKAFECKSRENNDSANNASRAIINCQQLFLSRIQK